MNPEPFTTYAQMRSRELRNTAARERLATAAARRRQGERLAALRAWFGLRTPRNVEHCPTC